MYLMILEDSVARILSSVSDDDLNACDSGMINLIIDLDPDRPKEYHEGEWLDIEEGIEDYL